MPMDIVERSSNESRDSEVELLELEDCNMLVVADDEEDNSLSCPFVLPFPPLNAFDSKSTSLRKHLLNITFSRHRTRNEEWSKVTFF